MKQNFPIFSHNIQTQHPIHTESYQPETMKKEIPLPYYLKDHNSRNQLTKFTQLPNTEKSLQMTMKSYLMGRSFTTLIKSLVIFRGTDPKCSVEAYFNAVTANLNLIIGSEHINTPLHQNWIRRRTALIQITLDEAARKDYLKEFYVTTSVGYQTKQLHNSL